MSGCGCDWGWRDLVAGCVCGGAGDTQCLGVAVVRPSGWVGLCWVWQHLVAGWDCAGGGNTQWLGVAVEVACPSRWVVLW